MVISLLVLPILGELISDDQFTPQQGVSRSSSPHSEM